MPNGAAVMDKAKTIFTLITSIAGIAAIIFTSMLYPIKADVADLKKDMIVVEKQCKANHDASTDMKWIKKSQDELKNEFKSFNKEVQAELKEFRKEIINILRQRSN